MALLGGGRRRYRVEVVETLVYDGVIVAASEDEACELAENDVVCEVGDGDIGFVAVTERTATIIS